MVKNGCDHSGLKVTLIIFVRAWSGMLEHGQEWVRRYRSWDS